MWFFYASLSAIFYALLWVLSRMSKSIPSSVVTAIQFVYGPIILLLVYRTVEFPWSEPWWQWYLILPFCIVPLMAWAMTYALHRLEVTVVKPLFALSSIATLMVSTLFFGESVSFIGMFGVVFITTGLFFLYQGRWEVWQKPVLWLVLLGAVIFGINAAVVAVVLHRFPHVLALSSIVMTGQFVFLSAPALPQYKAVVWSRRTVLILFLLGIVMVAQDLSTLFAFMHGPSSYVIAVKRTSVLLTAVIGFVFLHERDQSLWRLLGASALVTFGVAMLVLG